jgi:hypothetical protein
MASIMNQQLFIFAFAPISPQRLPSLATRAVSQSWAPKPLAALSDLQEDNTVSAAREVFLAVDTDNSGHICATELGEMMEMLNIDASPEDVDALFKYLDEDGNGEISLEEFEGWYTKTFDTAQIESDAYVVQGVISERRPVADFDETRIVENDVLERAIDCAIAAPQVRKHSEPWEFYILGEKTIERVRSLNQQVDPTWGAGVPGWCIVTSQVSDDPVVEKEDFASTCCAIQNMITSLWSENVGTKWETNKITKTPEFAQLCGIDTNAAQIVGCIWYGYTKGGLASLEGIEIGEKQKDVEDLLNFLE